MINNAMQCWMIESYILCAAKQVKNQAFKHVESKRHVVKSVAPIVHVICLNKLRITESCKPYQLMVVIGG